MQGTSHIQIDRKKEIEKDFLIKNNRENQKNDHSFPYRSISLL